LLDDHLASVKAPQFATLYKFQDRSHDKPSGENDPVSVFMQTRSGEVAIVSGQLPVSLFRNGER
jgi:hypothetical protein